jgi:hypothetical protein
MVIKLLGILFVIISIYMISIRINYNDWFDTIGWVCSFFWCVNSTFLHKS